MLSVSAARTSWEVDRNCSCVRCFASNFPRAKLLRSVPSVSIWVGAGGIVVELVDWVCAVDVVGASKDTFELARMGGGVDEEGLHVPAGDVSVTTVVGVLCAGGARGRFACGVRLGVGLGSCLDCFLSPFLRNVVHPLRFLK